MDKSILADTPRHPDNVRILEDARAHPERAYRQHVAAAERIAAESYREETRAMMRAGTPGPEEDELEGV